MSKILLIDDEPDLREIIRHQLGETDYNIFEAGNGVDAKYLVENKAPDVVILDLHLPDITGRELYNDLKNLGYKFECIVLSGNQDVQEVVRIMKAGVYDYLKKPVDKDRLQFVVKKAFEKVKLAHELEDLKAKFEDQPEHKLAAIMFTDMVGFTALSAVDQNKAYRLVYTQRTSLKPIVHKMGGDWLKEMGDGILISFASSLAAVRCAQKMMEKAKDIADLNLRISLHQGDIMFTGGDVYGDDVNISAKMLEFTEGGEIVISDKVQRDISSEPGIKTDYVGKPPLKGVKQEVRLYRVV